MAKVLTFGVLPEFSEFSAAFDRECPSGTFSFGNDSRVGSEELSELKLWAELTSAVAEFERGEEGAEVAGMWASSVLGVLGFEWV